MIYYFLYPYADRISILNVLRYVPFRVVAATLTAMLLTFGLYPWFIRRLRRRQIGQVVRKDGPEGHFSKAGTPTMGGSLMLLALTTATVLWADPASVMVWAVTAATVAHGFIGWLDDSLKIRKKSSGGLAARYKLLLQFLIAGSLCAYLWYGQAGLPSDWIALRERVNFPFVPFQRHSIALPPWVYVILATLFIAWTSNAVNLTDGLDGLAIGPVMTNAGVYMVFAYLSGAILFGRSVGAYFHLPELRAATELTIYCGALLGASFGFLWFNSYPAQVFMGDVGSLALGGGLGALAVVTKNEILSILIGGIFTLEAVSVVVQVVSFKTTGKRMFLMAPIHHHFEKKGWPEPKIIVRFWIISIALALAGLATLNLR